MRVGKTWGLTGVDQTATTMTMNSPDSLTELWKLATDEGRDERLGVRAAELMREVGLKCISFNGVRFERP